LALQYVVTLFSGVVLCDWAISEAFNLPANAIESLTEISLKCAIGVAILGAAFSRRWINPKSTLITTALFSLGLAILFVAVYIH
jgi:xanthine/uracil permease